jgi:hypothetical protein
MALWHDIATSSPPDGQIILIRRYPEDTPVLFGQFSATAAAARIGPAEWPLPWLAVTHWRTLPGPVPDWPPPPMTGRAWRDIFWQPPADGQSAWLRRYDNDCATIRATYNAAVQAFDFTARGWQIPWWAVWKWRPI